MRRLYFPVLSSIISIHAKDSLFSWIKWLDVEQQDQGVYINLFFKAFEI